MSLLALFLLTTIGCMFAVIFIIAKFISETKVGLWHAFVNGYLRNQIKYKVWINQFNIYYWSFLVLVTLIAIALMMLISFSSNRIFNRPEIVVYLSPFLWYGLYKCFLYYQNKSKEYS